MQISYTLLRGQTRQVREVITNILATQMICLTFIECSLETCNSVIAVFNVHKKEDVRKFHNVSDHVYWRELLHANYLSGKSWLYKWKFDDYDKIINKNIKLLSKYIWKFYEVNLTVLKYNYMYAKLIHRSYLIVLCWYKSTHLMKVQFNWYYFLIKI